MKADLPDRSEAHLIRHVYRSDHVMSQRAMAIAVTIIGAWADGVLKSRDEMNEEALVALLDQYELEIAGELAELYADTLWGVDDE